MLGHYYNNLALPQILYGFSLCKRQGPVTQHGSVRQGLWPLATISHRIIPDSCGASWPRSGLQTRLGEGGPRQIMSGSAVEEQGTPGSTAGHTVHCAGHWGLIRLYACRRGQSLFPGLISSTLPDACDSPVHCRPPNSASLVEVCPVGGAASVETCPLTICSKFVWHLREV